MELDCAFHEGPLPWEYDVGRKQILQWTLDLEEERGDTADGSSGMEVDGKKGPEVQVQTQNTSGERRAPPGLETAPNHTTAGEGQDQAWLICSFVEEGLGVGKMLS